MRLSKNQVANTGEFLRWLVEETWHSGNVMRIREEHLRAEGKNPQDDMVNLLGFGRHDSFAVCLARYTDRDVDKIRDAKSLEDLLDLIKEGKSWWEAVEHQTRKLLGEV